MRHFIQNKPGRSVRKHAILVVVLVSVVFFTQCDGKQEPEQAYQAMKVTATAYNSLPGQTLGHPAEAAWGDTLKPGMKVIAVSRDLIDSGLTYRTPVIIDGLPGTYLVMDKMNRRWKRKIDIYMGTSVKDALKWGRREVTIRWLPNKENKEITR
ncbi:3D domain-containing protein [Salinivirga cyanobacteriivorans]